MLLALGRNLPGLGAILQSLPVIGAFRTPVTWLTLSVLAATLLAARGLDIALASERRAWWGRAAIASVVLGGLILLARDALAALWLAGAQAATMDRIARGLTNQRLLERFAAAAPGAASAAVTDLGLQLVLVATALGALAWARRAGDARRTTATGVIITLAALLPCLTIVGPQLRAATGPRAALRAQAAPPLALAAAADPRHRAAWFEREWALSQRWSLSDDWVAWRARQVLGLSGAIPAAWDLAARSGLFASREFLRACAVRHVAMPGGAEGDTAGTWPDALPRAYAVPARPGPRERRERDRPAARPRVGSRRGRDRGGWGGAHVRNRRGGLDRVGAGRAGSTVAARTRGERRVRGGRGRVLPGLDRAPRWSPRVRSRAWTCCSEVSPCRR
jgi:hypothetical protein